MTETAMLPADVGSALMLQELAADWEDGPMTPEKNRTLEGMVVRAVQLANALQTVWLACSQEGSVWETEAYSLRMRAVELLALTVADILTRAGEIIASTRATQPEWVAPPAATEVGPSLRAAREVVTKIQGLVQWLNRPRPPVDQEMIRRSRESLSRDEGEAVSDIIARLTQGSPLIKE